MQELVRQEQPDVRQYSLTRLNLMLVVETGFELSLRTSFLTCSSSHCAVQFDLNNSSCFCPVLPIMVIVFQIESLMDTRPLNF